MHARSFRPRRCCRFWQTASSWRKTVALPPGKYRFQAQAKTAGVASSDGAAKGAGLRISGGARTTGLDGDSGWNPLVFEFDTPGGDVALVAELRATKGEVWFLAESMQLVKVK